MKPRGDGALLNRTVKGLLISDIDLTEVPGLMSAIQSPEFVTGVVFSSDRAGHPCGWLALIFCESFLAEFSEGEGRGGLRDELGMFESAERGQMKQDCDGNKKDRHDDQRVLTDELIWVVAGEKLDRRW